MSLPRPDRDVLALVRPFAEMGEAVVRIEVRDGHASVTVRGVPPATPPRVIVAAEPHRPYVHKTTDRQAFEAAAAEAQAAGADDALLLTSHGQVAEGTVWSVFWWEGDRLRTPALEEGILPGIGRARVLELAAVEEGSWGPESLAGRSLLLVNAVRGVVAVAAFASRAVPVEPRTAELSRRFWPD
jgi:branched-chain amino acid aminotransferase/4-amino-4-deoxychorismate lyase